MIDLRCVNMIFEGSSRSVQAIRDVSFTVAPGELVALVGPSGCGKTTLIRLIGGLLSPTDGLILVNGMSPAQARRQQLMAIVFQEPALLPWRTAVENVCLPGEILRRSDVLQRAPKLLQLVGLEEFRDALPRELSGGMQARVALGRALSVEPALLLMDEPFGQLDPLVREALQLELLAIWQRIKACILFITHDVGEAVFLADRVLVMTSRPGQIKADVAVPLPRPRRGDLRQETSYLARVKEVRRMLSEDQPRLRADA